MGMVLISAAKIVKYEGSISFIRAGHQSEIPPLPNLRKKRKGETENSELSIKSSRPSQ